MVQKFLKLINFDNRVRLEWVSASEGSRYASIVKDFTNQIKELGVSPAGGDNPNKEILDKLKAMQKATAGDRMRALVGRERKITEDANVYGDKVPIEKFNEIFDSAILEEYYRQRILLSLERDPKSVKDLAVELEINPSEVLQHMLVLKTRIQADFQKIVGNTPIFMKT